MFYRDTYFGRMDRLEIYGCSYRIVRLAMRFDRFTGERDAFERMRRSQSIALMYKY